MQPRHLNWPIISAIVFLAAILYIGYATSGERVALPEEINQLNLKTTTGPGGDEYLPLFSLMEGLNYKREYDAEQHIYRFGYTGSEFVYDPASKQFGIDGESRTKPVIIKDGEAYISRTTVDQLFDFIPEENIDFLTDEDIKILQNQNADYADDNKFTIQQRYNPDRIIRMATAQLNTPYLFGAPTGTTRVFDCSTFTKYLFAREGIHLPRTARMQAKRGVRVSKANLRKGDLMFFYIPGRFSSNRIVGHVAVYMGNGKMIHAYPPDVRIDSINHPTFRKTFLFAKRLR